MTRLKAHIRVVLPWYWRGYVWTARTARALGIPVDADSVAEAIVRRARVTSK